MWNPAQFAVDRPRVVLLFTLLLLLYGLLSYQGLARQENPPLENRFVSMHTYLPGADPGKVERLVTQVIEDQVAQVDDLDEIFSESTYGKSFLMVRISRSAPVELRMQEVRERVREAAGLLPTEASETRLDPRIMRTNTLVLALTGEGVPILALREQAEELERQLEALADVRRVDLVGVPEEEVDVSVDREHLSDAVDECGRSSSLSSATTSLV